MPKFNSLEDHFPQRNGNSMTQSTYNKINLENNMYAK
jgi:hypothetical protein